MYVALFLTAIASACGRPIASRPLAAPGFFVDAIGSNATVRLAETDVRVDFSTNFARLIEIRPLEEGNTPQQIAVHYLERRLDSLSCAHALVYPAIAVIDLRARQVVALARPPLDSLCATVPTYENPHHDLPPVGAYVDFPRARDGRTHPVLAASYGDGDPVYSSGRWGYLCLYHPGEGTNECGYNFAKIDTLIKPFREVGGFLLDVDGDGWEDVILIYHYTLQVISTRLARTIQTIRFNVAYPEDLGQHVEYAMGVAPPRASLKDLHSGRNYGAFTAVNGRKGQAHVIEVSGAPVGAFEDYMCNVSRYVASFDVIDARLHFAWSVFYGFHSSTFGKLDVATADDPPVERLGDFTNGCIHRFSESIAPNQDIVVFNAFHADADIDRCLREQYALYLPPVTNWGDAKYATWIRCAEKSRSSRGTWSIQALQLDTGARVDAPANAYLWGWSDKLVPGQVAYLVQATSSQGTFDLRRDSTALEVFTFSAGAWVKLGAFPSSSARPLIRSRAARGHTGTGAYTSLAELTLEDRDADGYVDVQMSDKTWIGYDPQHHRFVTKN